RAGEEIRPGRRRRLCKGEGFSQIKIVLTESAALHILQGRSLTVNSKKKTNQANRIVNCKNVLIGYNKLGAGLLLVPQSYESARITGGKYGKEGMDRKR
ncbi:MAG: hypothetical protein K6E18_07220, partial [Lachnospiraceae bacterium]|nr:hypothetical protein [Lachnospiraceae bacterium]